MLAILAEDNFLTLAALAVPSAFVAVVAIVADAWRKAAQTRHREESRREIAAYIAEGSIPPEEGARLMAAGGSIKDKLGMKS